MTPMMQIVWDVLEKAKDNNDVMVIAACRRLIVANRIRRLNTDQDKADKNIVLAFA